MSHDAALVLAGGLVGFLSSVVALWLQRVWAVRDRRAASDRESLDLAVRHLMAWHDYARSLMAGTPDREAEKRMLELDLRWEADARLIPDHAAATELLRLCKSIIAAPPEARSGPESIAAFDRIVVLGGLVVESARAKRRDLA